MSWALILTIVISIDVTRTEAQSTRHFLTLSSLPELVYFREIFFFGKNLFQIWHPFNGGCY